MLFNRFLCENKISLQINFYYIVAFFIISLFMTLEWSYPYIQMIKSSSTYLTIYLYEFLFHNVLFSYLKLLSRHVLRKMCVWYVFSTKEFPH